MTTVICNEFWGCVQEYQTLISGSLAILAAVVTTSIIYRIAMLPIVAERENAKEEHIRMLTFTKLKLSVELLDIAKQTRQAASTIKVVAASNVMIDDETRARTSLPLGGIFTEWKFLSLFTEETLKRILKFHRRVEDYNRDIQKSGGAFGADSWREHLFRQLDAIEVGAHGINSLVIGAELE